MYAAFFGLRELPFNNTPDPRFFFSTPDHEEALASLIYAVSQRKGFVLLTGEVGAGKTLVSRMMLRHFDRGIAFANINHSIATADELLDALCAELSISLRSGLSRTAKVRRLHDFLLARFAENTPVALILDEAQGLPYEAFELLRTIGNLEAEDAKLLQTMILGQPELRRRFAAPQMRQLQQRIFRSFHLSAMDRATTAGYICHRLKIASQNKRPDGAESIFREDALDRIYNWSQGIPRLVNAICDNAMLSAYSADRKEIDAASIETVASQMMSHAESNRSEEVSSRGLEGSATSDAAPIARQARIRETSGLIDEVRVSNSAPPTASTSIIGRDSAPSSECAPSTPLPAEAAVPHCVEASVANHAAPSTINPRESTGEIVRRVAELAERMRQRVASLDRIPSISVPRPKVSTDGSRRLESSVLTAIDRTDSLAASRTQRTISDPPPKDASPLHKIEPTDVASSSCLDRDDGTEDSVPAIAPSRQMLDWDTPFARDVDTESLLVSKAPRKPKSAPPSTAEVDFDWWPKVLREARRGIGDLRNLLHESRAARATAPRIQKFPTARRFRADSIPISRLLKELESLLRVVGVGPV